MITRIAIYKYDNNNYKYLFLMDNEYFHYIKMGISYNRSFRKLPIGDFLNSYDFYPITFRTNIEI
jgi:hypothetical protein